VGQTFLAYQQNVSRPAGPKLLARRDTWPTGRKLRWNTRAELVRPPFFQTLTLMV